MARCSGGGGGGGGGAIVIFFVSCVAALQGGGTSRHTRTANCHGQLSSLHEDDSLFLVVAAVIVVVVAADITTKGLHASEQGCFSFFPPAPVAIFLFLA
jgi:hypothetical protein